MPKKNHKFIIRQQNFGECNICDYKTRSWRGINLHMKYSHPDISHPVKKNDDPVVVCGICKKKNCKTHL